MSLDKFNIEFYTNTQVQPHNLQKEATKTTDQDKRNTWMSFFFQEGHIVVYFPENVLQLKNSSKYW